MLEVIALLATWLINYFLHSTVLLGGAWLADRLNLIRPPGAREFVWRVALVGGVLTATLQIGFDALNLPRPSFLPSATTVLMGAPHDPAPVETWATPVVAPSGLSGTLSRTAAELAAAVAPTVVPHPTQLLIPRRAGPGTEVAALWPCVLCALWLLAAALAAMRLGLLTRLAFRELAGRESDAGSQLHQQLMRLCAANPGAAPRLTRSASLTGPVSLPNGEICVPEWVATALARAQQEALLAHELAHLRRRDPQWLLFTRLLHTVLIGQPLNGLARTRLASLAELEADAWAARAVGDARSLAECLAACAEHLEPERAALFGTAMAGRSSLLERVHRLLEGLHVQTEKISHPMRAGALLTLIAVAVLVPVIVVRAGDRRAGSTSISVDNELNGHELSVKVTRPGYSLKGTLDGDIGFSDSETDVAAMNPGAILELEENLSGTTHRVKLESRDGRTITRTYWLDGEEQPLGAAGQAWFAKTIPALQRAAMKPEARVDRLLARGGVTAVLDEIAAIDDDYNRSRYLVALLAARPLSTTEFERALQCAAQIGSEYERRSTIQAALARTADPVCQTAILTAAKDMGGDFETAAFLTEAASQLGAAAPPWDAWFEIADDIDSRFELRRSYTALLKNGRAPSSAVARVLTSAGADFDSDFDLCEVLASAMPRLSADPALVAAYVTSIRDLESDYERGRALSALLDGTRLDAAGCGRVMDVIASIGGDFERAGALIALAKRMPADAALLARYRSVARTLSAYQRGRAEQALDHLTL